MKAFNQKVLVLLTFFCAFNLNAQNDFGLWTGVQLKAPISTDFSLGLEGEMRFDRNVSRMKTAFLSPSIDYDIAKHFSVSCNYRLSSSPLNSTISNRVYSHRFALDLEFKNILELMKDKSRLAITFRLRGTTEHENAKRNDSYARVRIKADYDIPKSKVEPFIYAELFYHINDQVIYTFEQVKTVHRINKFRASFGFKYALSKKHEIKIFSIFQRQLLKAENDFIVGASYAHTITKLKK